MTPHALRKKVVEEFDSLGLLKCLDLETSAFSELPRCFEAPPVLMRLVLNDVAAVAEASSIAAKMKRDLERQGVQFQYEIRAQWKVASFGPGALERCGDAGWMPSEHFQVEMQSGSARRCVAIHVSAEAIICILQYLAHVPPGYRQSAIYRLLETCINQKLSARAEEYWDPVLYQSRNIERQDVARIVESRVQCEREPMPAI